MKPKNHIFYSTLLSLLFLTLSCVAQDEAAKKLELVGPAYVNYNLGKSPAVNPTRQSVTLVGCNTRVTTDSTYWNKALNLEWETQNQVLGGIPFGWQQTGEDTPYYVSKYYQISPPVFPANYNPDADQVTIGLVIPDRFTFFGNAPVQQTYLDYEILEPVYLNYSTVNYEYPNAEYGTCAAQFVNEIPLNIECKDFNWKNRGVTPNIRNGQGASGIARIKNDSDNNRRIFLPSYMPQGEQCLDCTVTILDDIMLNTEVFFVVDGKEYKTISLTDFYKAHVRNKKNPTSIGLSCKPRLELPEGCRPPEGVKAVK